MTRKLDYLAGKHLFGYTVYHYDKDVAERCFYMLMDANFDLVCNLFKGERKIEAEAWEDCPHFTSDIGAAWPIVDRLRADGLLLVLNEIYFDDDSPPWMAQFEDKNAVNGGYAFAEEPPLAITVAALRAVGVPESEIREAMRDDQA